MCVLDHHWINNRALSPAISDIRDTAISTPLTSSVIVFSRRQLGQRHPQPFIIYDIYSVKYCHFAWIDIRSVRLRFALLDRRNINLFLAQNRSPRGELIASSAWRHVKRCLLNDWRRTGSQISDVNHELIPTTQMSRVNDGNFLPSAA